jgi:hypothetical protein
MRALPAEPGRGRGHGRSDLGPNIPSYQLHILPKMMIVHYCCTLLVVSCVMASVAI